MKDKNKVEAILFTIGKLLTLEEISKLTSIGSNHVKGLLEGLKKEYSGDNSRLMKEMGQFNFTPLERAMEDLHVWYNSRKDLIDKKLLLLNK